LSKNQRSELCELLSRDASDAWWNPVTGGMMVDPAAEAMFACLAGQRLGHFVVPDAELKRILTPSQSAVLADTRQPHQQEVVFVQRAARQRALAQAAPAAAREQQALARVQAQLNRRVVRRGPTLEDQERLLARYVEQRLDELDAACDLSPSQRDKLSLAARLDLARWRDEKSNVSEKLNDGEELIVQQVQVQGGWGLLPVNVFNDTDSYFNRSLQSRLLEEQKGRLKAAARARSEFQRKALVEAIVTGFERAASLTSAQCDAVAGIFSDALADFDTDDPSWRSEYMRRLIHLPFDELRPLLFDFQLAASERQLAELADSARQFRGWWANQ
jgi:hypothetical protein